MIFLHSMLDFGPKIMFLFSSIGIDEFEFLVEEYAKKVSVNYLELMWRGTTPLCFRESIVEKI